MPYLPGHAFPEAELVPAATANSAVAAHPCGGGMCGYTLVALAGVLVHHLAPLL